MPVKCSFCRKRYERAGAYESHLRIAHSNLDIVLASIIRNPPADVLNHRGAGLSDANEAIEHPDSDYESDPAGDLARNERDAHYDTFMQESDTEAPEDNMSSVAPEKEDYPRAGEAIGDVRGYTEERSNLCEEPWAPFSCAEAFKLASWFIESKVSKTRINEYFSSGIGNSTLVGYSSMHTLENHLRHLDRYGPYLQWFEGHVEDGQRTLPFFYRDILDCVRYLLRQIAYRDDLVYAPCREYDQSGQRIYAEMHTADWWWDVQVLLRRIFYLKAY